MNNENIGKRIKDRRKELQLSLQDISNETGISTGNLSGIEKGNVLPSSKNLIKLSQILECSTDYILLGKNKGQDIDGDIRAVRLLSCFYAMCEEDKTEILMLADFKARKGGVTSLDSDQESDVKMA